MRISFSSGAPLMFNKGIRRCKLGKLAFCLGRWARIPIEDGKMNPKKVYPGGRLIQVTREVQKDCWKTLIVVTL